MAHEDFGDLEYLDPHVDIFSLFQPAYYLQHYSRLYFSDQLGAASVEWSSKRMTLCAGTCQLHGNGGGVVIKLSEPLLQFRPLRDLKDTLLHEMIHALLFLDGRWRQDGDHGPLFKSYAKAINEATCPDHQRPVGGYNVTVYHTMHAEVDEHRKHRWTCQRCGNTIKRAMNRPPQPADCVTTRGKGEVPCGDTRCSHCMHARHCGGQYDKVMEPEGYSSKGGKGRAKKGTAGAEQQQPPGSGTSGGGHKLGGGGGDGNGRGDNGSAGGSGERGSDEPALGSGQGSSSVGGDGPPPAQLERAAGGSEAPNMGDPEDEQAAPLSAAELRQRALDAALARMQRAQGRRAGPQQGGVTRSRYSPDLHFEDPITRLDGLDAYILMVRAIKTAFKVTFDLHTLDVTGPDEISARRVDPTSGLITSHVDTWDAVTNNSFPSAEGIALVVKQIPTILPLLDHHLGLTNQFTSS
ncbi:putative Zinc finger RAD18 domain-containing [Monoraphidium neglectum]|uniref:Putative Zinc finger RAD18 domain-containing n=1 Tax=Monoraphidium neglectum TaxID=145388 RepID=A0A0D2MJL6_9CHLO|nr:putative Zinc finger RAD18 domain-containing [Monoraphidium neglectum]KIZ00822.1 putative Zinc finger RAD18 domain-containing [Monoraphidium neglectum]|eukprot:XP_013899841.1 putative Zinc finger RAD18 domain-containing [Monoraphidium neglectum]